MTESRVALVTGANKGIGNEILKLLSANGYTVVGTSRSSEGVSIIEKSLAGKAGCGLIFDVTDKDATASLNSKIKEKYGNVSVLVNNAGITRDSILLRMKDHQWDDVLNTNLKGAFYATKSVLRSMMKNKYGRIINITSIVGLQGNSGQSNYSASKAGLIGFSQSVAKEVASRGITINCIAPGWIETEMTNDLPQDIKSEIIKNIPIGKTGTTEDIAYTALFLASKESKYITGQTITVDGGRVIN